MKFLNRIFLISTLSKPIRKINTKAININKNKINENLMHRMHDKLFLKTSPSLSNYQLKMFFKNDSLDILNNKNNKTNVLYTSIIPSLKMSELNEFINYAYIYQRDLYPSIARDVLRNIESKWKILNPTKENILHLTFFILAYQPKVPSSTLMNCIEEFINRNIAKFSFSDLSIIAFCFFATNTRYSNYKTASNMSAQFISSIKCIDLDVKRSPFLLSDVSNMLKSLRHIHYRNITFYEDIGDILCNILQTQSEHMMSPANLSQLCSIIFSFSSLQIYHKNLIQIITHIIEATDHRIRLKDYGRLLWSMSYFRHPLNTKLIERFSRFLDLDLNEGIVKMHVTVFIECLVGFCLHQYFHQRGMLALFSHEILNIYKSNKLEQNNQISFLHAYLGLQNKEDIVNINENMFFDNFELEVKTRQGFHSLLRCFYTIFKSDITKFKCTYILPFSKIPDIELRINSDHKIVSFNNDSTNSAMEAVIKNFKNVRDKCGSISNIELLMNESNIAHKKEYEHIHFKPNDCQIDIRKICIKIFGQNQYLVNDQKIDGYNFAQLKMLQDLQYEVYIIDPNIAEKLDRSNDSLKIVKNILDELKIIV